MRCHQRLDQKCVKLRLLVAGRALPTSSEGSVTTHGEISPLQDKASTVVVRGGHSGTSEGAGVRGLEAGARAAGVGRS